MIKLFALGLIGTIAGVMSAAPSTMVRRGPSVCASNDDFMKWILHFRRNNLLYDDLPAHWEIVGLTPTDTLRIQPVTIDSLCNIAGLTISQDVKAPDSTSRRIYMVTEGKYYLAVDHKLMGGEFVTAYFLDSTLTKVIERYAM
jgi:hypothetical protein